MKSIRLILISLILACFALMGCAKNQMTLTLSIYDHDPRAQIPLTPKKTSKLLVDIEDIEAESNILYNAQIDYAAALLEFARTYVEELTPVIFGDLQKKKSDTQEAIQEGVLRYNNLHKNHITELSSLHNILKSEVEKARGHIINYVDVRDELARLMEVETGKEKEEISRKKSFMLAERARISNRLGKVAIAAFDQSRSIDDDFTKVFKERYLVLSIQGVANALAKKSNSAPEKENISKLLAALNELLKTIELHAKNITHQTSILKTNISAAQQSLESPGAPLSRSANLIAKAATAASIELRISDRGATALNSIVRSTDLLFSQIDRLQDPADPVLRIITNPENEKYWNQDPVFSKTHFYAEGDSSVVIVRDAPNSYRVQRGDNDPSALVQSQLIVSRAVGDAAITVAGAVAGLHLSTYGEGSDDKMDSPLTPTDHTAADTYAEKRARVKAHAEMMNRVTKSFRMELQIFRRELAAAAIKTEKDALIRELSGKLTSYKTFYEESE